MDLKSVFEKDAEAKIEKLLAERARIEASAAGGKDRRLAIVDKATVKVQAALALLGKARLDSFERGVMEDGVRSVYSALADSGELVKFGDQMICYL